MKAVAAAVEDADDGADSDDSHGSDAKTPPKRAAAGKKGAAASSKAVRFAVPDTRGWALHNEAAVSCRGWW